MDRDQVQFSRVRLAPNGGPVSLGVVLLLLIVTLGLGVGLYLAARGLWACPGCGGWWSVRQLPKEPMSLELFWRKGVPFARITNLQVKYCCRCRDSFPRLEVEVTKYLD